MFPVKHYVAPEDCCVNVQLDVSLHLSPSASMTLLITDQVSCVFRCRPRGRPPNENHQEDWSQIRFGSNVM